MISLVEQFGLAPVVTVDCSAQPDKGQLAVTKYFGSKSQIASVDVIKARLEALDAGGDVYGTVRRPLGAILYDSLRKKNPLAAMCNYRNTHSTERLPVKPVNKAKEAPAGICAVAGFDHRPGAWK